MQQTLHAFINGPLIKTDAGNIVLSISKWAVKDFCKSWSDATADCINAHKFSPP
jgi:hypothetical protein